MQLEGYFSIFVDILETDNLKRQSETIGFLLHDKGLLPSPAQLSPLLTVSWLQW